MAQPASAAPPATTSGPVTAEALVAAAEALEARGLSAQAREAWQRVLLVAPEHEEALAALVALHARRAEASEASSLLARLRHEAPNHPSLPRLAIALELGRAFDAHLEDARALVRAGLVDEAARRYRALFVDAPPRRLVAEYWETVGATEAGWAQARAALEALGASPGVSPRVRLALARLSTVREETRREGLRALDALVGVAEVKAEALEARRRALVWLVAGPDDAALYRAHLAEAGPDAELEARLADLSRRTGPDRVQAAFRAIDDARLDRATELLERSIAEQGRRVEALLGLAVVAMREQDFARARGLLDEVKAGAPGRPELWAEPLATARAWALFHEAAASERAGRLDDAAMKLEACLAEPEAPAASVAAAAVALGRVASSLGAPSRAEPALRRALSSSPDAPGVLRALAVLLARTGRRLEAEALAARLAEAAPREAFADKELEVEELHARATAARAEDLAGAVALLEAAAHLRANEAVLVELVHAALSLGEPERATRAAEHLTTLAPRATATQLAWAHLYHRTGRLPEARARLRAIAEGDATPEVRALAERLDIADVIAQAEARSARGHKRGARALVAGLERRVDGRPELVGEVALAWSTLGAHDEAITLVRRALAATSALGCDAPGATPERATDGRAETERAETERAAPERATDGAACALRGTLGLWLAIVLDRAGRDDEAARQIDALERTSLAAADVEGLERLVVARVVRRAESLRAEGRLAAARALVAEALAEHEGDPELVAVRAQLALADDDPDEAAELFEGLLAGDDARADWVEGAARASLARGLPARARLITTRATSRRPDDARLGLAAGRIEAEAGDDRRALALFEGARPKAPPSVRAAIDEAVAELRARHAVSLGGDVRAKSRAGEAGLGALSSLALGTELSVPTRAHGRVELHVTPILLARGRLDPADAGAPFRFGTGALAPDAGVDAASAAVRGVALGLEYGYERCSAGLGTTPLGFTLSTAVGHARCSAKAGALELAVSLARRSVEDSLLSWAGMIDGPSGGAWGGVTANGGRLEAAWSSKGTSAFVRTGAEWLLGRGVPDNGRLEAGVGLDLHLHETRTFELGAGVRGYWMGYQRNLRQFTLGHGGYFSPQTFIHVGVPVELRWSMRDVTAKLRAEPGLDAFHEDGARYYPTDAARQELLTRRAATGRAPADGFRARDQFGAAFSGSAEVTWSAGPGLAIGLGLDVHAAESYREVSAVLSIEQRLLE